MEVTRGIRIQGKIELIFPAELEARLRQRVVADLRCRVPLGQIGGVGGDLVGDDAFLDVVPVGQAEMLLGRHIAQHRRTVPANHGSADARGNVIVSRRDVGGERTQGIERRFEAIGQLLFEVLLDELHGNVAGPFDHDLHVMLPGNLGELAEGLQLAELRLVIGIGDGARAQPVAEGEGHVVLLHQLAHVFEVLVEEALGVVGEAPLGHDRAASGDDARDAIGGQRHILEAHAGVDGEVVHALLGLLDEGVAEHLPGELFGLAVDLLQCLIDGHRADGHRAVPHDPLAGLVECSCRWKDP